jgi:ribose transport system substrate-binding protein
MHHRTLFQLLSTTAAALLLNACGDGGSPDDGGGASTGGADPGGAGSGATPTPTDNSKVIGYSMLSAANPFFQVISDAMKDEAAKHGYSVIAVSGDLKVEKQREQVEDFIARKVSAIVLNPCDSKAIGPVIEKANDAGIPVFTCDIKSLSETGKVEAHIATDNKAGGVQAGEAMGEAMGEEGGKVAIIDYKSAESCLLRVAGFKEAIDHFNENNATIRIEIVRELGGEGDREKGRTAAQDIIQAVPDIRGIFAINDPSALGAASAIEDAGKTGQITLVAFDGNPEAKKAIRDGIIYASPIQFPSKMGRETVTTIIKYFNGEEIEEEQLIPPYLYKKEDADKDENIDNWAHLQQKHPLPQATVALVVHD